MRSQTAERSPDLLRPSQISGRRSAWVSRFRRWILTLAKEPFADYGGGYSTTSYGAQGGAGGGGFMGGSQGGSQGAAGKVIPDHTESTPFCIRLTY